MHWDSLKDKSCAHQIDFGQQQIHKSRPSAWFSHPGAQKRICMSPWREYSKKTPWREMGMGVPFHWDAMQSCFTQALSKNTMENGYKLYTLSVCSFSRRTGPYPETKSSPGKRHKAKVLFLIINALRCILLAYVLEWTNWSISHQRILGKSEHSQLLMVVKEPWLGALSKSTYVFSYTTRFTASPDTPLPWVLEELLSSTPALVAKGAKYSTWKEV